MNTEAFAYKLGAQASRLGKDRHNNPYRRGTYSYQLWQRGWESENDSSHA